ncbi:ATP-binding protein [Marivita sp.]|uniref:ATP-binding protein n=1 Tax=Marivita sp. TaxID=2003365 RepID=UPI003F705B63
MFSWHLGRLQSGSQFEGEVLLVTGESGAGKTTELVNLLRDFNSHGVALPNGTNASIKICLLDGKGTWKDLGKNTLHATGYSLSERARSTQSKISRRIKQQGEGQGIVGIWYDEVQHILARKNDAALEEVLDCFKTMLKGPDWPMLLILSGVRILEDQIPKFEQLFRKVTHVRLEEINFEEEAETINSIVQSYALEAKLAFADELFTDDFLHRLATASAFRWGVVCELTMKAVCRALTNQSSELNRNHFIDTWASKTGMHEATTPYTHSAYATAFRRTALFQSATYS